jgi:hypothetical protein
MLLIAALTVALAAPVFGQHEHGTQKIDDGKSHNISAMMGTRLSTGRSMA